ncbi:hypothetical protein CNR22_20945 [Sphingobacteriaceae bacterium]|nr:hypothetical protein CNR22_20945 [Sphingobacteriaceae bacterium]
MVDLNKFSGKWYVIATIPTGFDKEWDYTTETYTLNKKGKIDIYTTYCKKGEEKEKSVKSKGFPNKETFNISWKVQFVWPFKADYLIEELSPDYTYVVVGHPKKKFLYIMNRSGKMGQIQYNEIVERFKERGYDVSKLQKVKQGF